MSKLVAATSENAKVYGRQRLFEAVALSAPFAITQAGAAVRALSKAVPIGARAKEK